MPYGAASASAAQELGGIICGTASRKGLLPLRGVAAGVMGLWNQADSPQEETTPLVGMVIRRSAVRKAREGRAWKRH